MGWDFRQTGAGCRGRVCVWGGAHSIDHQQQAITQQRGQQQQVPTAHSLECIHLQPCASCNDQVGWHCCCCCCSPVIAACWCWVCEVCFHTVGHCCGWVQLCRQGSSSKVQQSAMLLSIAAKGSGVLEGAKLQQIGSKHSPPCTPPGSWLLLCCRLRPDAAV